MRAQTYPSRPITLIVPLPPGVGTDAIARTIAEHMKGSLGQRDVPMPESESGWGMVIEINNVRVH